MNNVPPSSLSRFDARWLAEALRLHEQHLGDELSVRFSEPLLSATSGSSGTEEAWILRRAQVIGAELGMLETIRTWRRHANVVLVLLGAVAVITGFTAALGFFGAENRAVNVIWTLLGLIGLPLLALLLWIVGMVISAGGQASGGIFGRLWLWLVSHWPMGVHPSGINGMDGAHVSDAEGRQKRAKDSVARALALLMNSSGLGQWWISVITHSLWLILLTTTLVGMLLALSLRSYGFVLETTILPPEVFSRLVQGFGALPARVGFAVPDADMIAMALTGDVATQTEPARRAWSSWLIGGLLVYALLPRLLAWGVAVWRLQFLFRRMDLDLSQPGYDEAHSPGDRASGEGGETTLPRSGRCSATGSRRSSCGRSAPRPRPWRSAARPGTTRHHQLATGQYRSGKANLHGRRDCRQSRAAAFRIGAVQAHSPCAAARGLRRRALA